jgi:hypothetical protein
VEAHFGQHPDVEIYLSQPGMGPIVGARVLAEFGDDERRYVDTRARKNHAGTSPITRSQAPPEQVLPCRPDWPRQHARRSSSSSFAAARARTTAPACVARLARTDARSFPAPRRIPVAIDQNRAVGTRPPRHLVESIQPEIIELRPPTIGTATPPDHELRLE